MEDINGTSKKMKRSTSTSDQSILPIDILKEIIELCPCIQWFTVSKEISRLASQIISPLNYRTSDKGSFYWAVQNNKIHVVESLLKNPLIDPAANDNIAFRVACRFGHKEIVELLLTDPRVDPSADDSSAIVWASCAGHKEIVELLLQGK
jgi:hypothetical protein